MTCARSGCMMTEAAKASPCQPSSFSASSLVVFRGIPCRWFMMSCNPVWLCGWKACTSAEEMFLCPGSSRSLMRTLVQRKHGFRAATPLQPVSSLMPSASATMVMERIVSNSGFPSKSTVKPSWTSLMMCWHKWVIDLGYPKEISDNTAVRAMPTVTQLSSSHGIIWATLA